MKEKKIPEFPPARVSSGRFKKLATFHDYLMKKVLEKDVDYNTKTMSLKKPGADKIIFILQLVPDYELMDAAGQFDQGFICVRKIKCILRNAQGLVKAVGLGECNSGEKKNTNAVLKIAKKRAYVDAAISASFTSRLFTQDVEDTGPTYKAFENVPTQKEVETAAAQSRESAAQPSGISDMVQEVSGEQEEPGPNIFTQTEDEPDNVPSRLRSSPGHSRFITHRQINYLFAEARDNKKAKEEVTGALSTLGLRSPTEIPFQKFDDWLDWARGKISLFDLSDRMK